MDKKSRPFSVLFICTANLCRSPMASAIFKDILAKKFPSFADMNWLVESAGTWAVNGEAAALGAQAALASRELTLINHRSRPISADLLGRFNLVLVMEEGQKEALQFEFPRYAQKFHLLSEMIGEKFDIKDPMGGSLLDYETTAREIDDILQLGFEKILQLAK